VSGKTVLSRLLQSHISEIEPQALIYWTDSWMPPYKSHGQALKSRLRVFPDYNVKTYLLFDEGQQTYNDLDLWNGFFKNLEMFPNYRVVLFCSYGSPDMEAYASTFRDTPVNIPDDRGVQLWPLTNIPGLLLSKEEFCDLYVRRISELHIHNSFKVDEPVLNLLYNWTEGHVGAVSFFLILIERKVTHFMYEISSNSSTSRLRGVQDFTLSRNFGRIFLKEPLPGSLQEIVRDGAFPTSQF
jgi:hypothetical protein